MKYATNKNAITRCDATTGHVVTPVAFCASAAIATEIVEENRILREALIVAKNAIDISTIRNSAKCIALWDSVANRLEEAIRRTA